MMSRRAFLSLLGVSGAEIFAREVFGYNPKNDSDSLDSLLSELSEKGASIPDPDKLDDFISDLIHENKEAAKLHKKAETVITNPTSRLLTLANEDVSLVGEALELGEKHQNDFSYNLLVRRTLKYADYIRDYKGNLEFQIIQGKIICESGVDPRAKSETGAVGLPQLMKKTARSVGLTVNRVIDERFDPERSIYGGCKYLNELFETYGDLRLALIAYNGGPKRIEEIKDAGLDKESWREIKNSGILKEETVNYVPRVFAVSWLAMIQGDKFGKPELYSKYISENSAPYTVMNGENLKSISERYNVRIHSMADFNPKVINFTADIGGEEIRIPLRKT